MWTCESVRIASILPLGYALPYPITFAMCASHEQYFEISSSRYVYWSAIGNYYFPHFHLKVTGVTLSSSLHTTTAHFFAFAVTFNFLVHFSTFPTCFCNPSGLTEVLLISPRDYPRTPIPTCRHRISPPPLLRRLLLYNWHTLKQSSCGIEKIIKNSCFCYLVLQY